MVRSTGFEPVTLRLEGGCSIQLSYERMCRAVVGSEVGCVKNRVAQSANLLGCGQLYLPNGGESVVCAPWIIPRSF
jgi:hypothetical protein